MECPNCGTVMMEDDNCPKCDHIENSAAVCDCFTCRREREEALED